MILPDDSHVADRLAQAVFRVHALQIRTLFLVSTCALATMAAGLGCAVLAQALIQYQGADRVEQAVGVGALLLGAADRLAAERPAEGDKLLADRTADAASRATLATIRAEADRALDTLDARLGRLSYKTLHQQRSVVHTVRDRLDALRRYADAMILLPKREREPQAFEHFLTGFNALAVLLDDAQDLRDVAAAQQDGVTMDLIELAREVWAIRMMLGPRTGRLMTLIDAAKPIDSLEHEAQASFDSAVAQRRAQVASLLRRLATIPGLSERAVAAESAIDAQERILQDIVAAGVAGAPYPSTAVAIGRVAVQTGQVVSTLRDAALAAARRRVADTKRAAVVRSLVVGGLVALTLVGTLAILLLLKRRIVEPVLALTKAIGRFAQRDFAADLPPARPDEIGQMTEAVETLRRAAIAAEAAEAQIAHLAHHDTLTGLTNRRTLQDRLNQAIAASARGHKCALLYLDLDRFKAVNDTYGHPVGDQLLKSVAERLLACVRQVDTVSRFGGDEFAVLLVDLEQPESAGRVAERIVHAVSEPYELEGLALDIGVSVGIAIAPRDARSAVALMKSADTALYNCKSEEKGSYRFFAPEMQAALEARSVLEQDLREAVRDSAFEVVYQPQYAIASGRIDGFEALVRWRHPLHGLVGPDNFLALAEETRLIVPIGAWVLQQACAEAAKWPGKTKVAVNLSAVQLKTRDIVAIVRGALATSGLPPERLELEVMESVLLSTSSDALAVLHELRGLGTHISLDGFGTGYSSLSFLRRFAFGKIKIDRSFIHALSLDPRSLAIIRAVVGLGRSLDLTIAAVGVETDQQLEQVRREGCTEVQGELFSAPVPGEVARRMLAREDGDTLALSAQTGA
jgi:diguanylate cyclase (GGDEF)-like protein